MAETAETGPPTGSRPVPDPTALSVDLIEREVKHLRELLERQLTCEQELRNEQIALLRTRMSRTEEQRLEQKADTQTAIGDALTAQKEAVDKSETATTKQLEEIKGTIATTVDGLRREFGDLKERVGAVEQQKVGRQESEVNNREEKQGVTTLVGLAIAAAGAFVALAGVATAIVIAASQ